MGIANTKDAAYQKERLRWLSLPNMEPELLTLLQNQTEQEVEDSFACQLAFGTGGLRGVLGAGTNRMNIYTVRKATQGLANYLNASDLPKRVAIGYDSRIKSTDFAQAAASVLAANGIQALLYPRLEPTPALSFAVRQLCCGAGICVTASHNPAQYNGYKVYGADGCQVTLEAAETIQKEMAGVDVLMGARFADFDEALENGSIQWIAEEILDEYLAAVKAESLALPGDDTSLSVVYTPLHGAGRECVMRTLHDISVDVHMVKEQEMPDGHFPTCPYPNPEIPEAMALGLQLCEKVQPDLLLATDPDCDRVGIAVPSPEGYVILSGNAVGELLLDYVCTQRRLSGRMPEQPVAVTTIVSSAMASLLAKKHGIELRRTLTGFKFIGEQIGLLESAGQATRFIFGFEESDGYLSGSYVRDKDGVNAALLICEMARYHKRAGRTLWQALSELYLEFGYHHTELNSFSFPGLAGMQQMQEVMAALRGNPPKTLGGKAVAEVLDYAAESTGLPKADVLELRIVGGGKVMIRPSGTEPKMKAYLFTVAGSKDEAEEAAEQVRQELRELGMEV